MAGREAPASSLEARGAARGTAGACEEKGEEGVRHRDTIPALPALGRKKLSIAGGTRKQAQHGRQGEERKGPPGWLQVADLAPMLPHGPGRGNAQPGIPALATASPLPLS